MKVTVEIPDEDFTVREGVAVVSGWTQDGGYALRIVSIENAPVWIRAGLLDAALQAQRQILFQGWADR